MTEIGIDTTIMQSILTGAKTIEGRLRTAKFVTVRTGDTLNLREDTWKDDRLVSSITDRAIVTVTGTQFFDSFVDMFAAIDYKHAVPTATTKDEAIALYRQFYTKEQEEEHGVVAISFKLQ